MTFWSIRGHSDDNDGLYYFFSPLAIKTTLENSMTYFYVSDEGILIRLAGFSITEGQTYVVRIPLFGGSFYQRTRKDLDTFRMTASGLLPQVSRFRIVDENANVYGCVGITTNIVGGSLIVDGIVHDKWEAEQKEEAIRAIRQAMCG